MKRQGLIQQQNKSQSDIHPSSGWLQRAAVREVPENELKSAVEGKSGLNRSFVNVPVGGGGLPVVQRKLTIGKVGDRYEQEAEHQPSQKKENNTGLPDNLKSGIENLSGYSMDGVKVHYNSDKPAQLQAHAYAQGTDIHVASGQEKHLPHEAWHVVQQMQGRVKPTMQAQGVAINDNPALEREAVMMGAKGALVNPSDCYDRSLMIVAYQPKNRESAHQNAPIQLGKNNKWIKMPNITLGAAPHVQSTKATGAVVTHTEASRKHLNDGVAAVNTLGKITEKVEEDVKNLPVNTYEQQRINIGLYPGTDAGGKSVIKLWYIVYTVEKWNDTTAHVKVIHSGPGT